MKGTERDLMLLFKQELMSPQAVQKEMSFLNLILFNVERISTLASTCELIDIARGRMIRKPVAIKSYLKLREGKPFVFLFNRN
jgi:hypothetical protein